MKRSWRVVLAVTAVFALTFAVSGAAFSAEKTSTTKAASMRGGESADPNIKAPEAKNDPAKKPAAPPQKGGPKERGGYCKLTADNWTPWYITIYVDGQNVGQVSPFGEASGFYSSGDLVLYGKATFTDGSAYTWGPKVATCTTSFTWKLTQ